jgi:cysteate synthase
LIKDLADFTYTLKCPNCEAEYVDDGIRLDCDVCSDAGRKVILEYCPVRMPSINTAQSGLARYAEFLPGKYPITSEACLTKTFKSENLAGKYGFENLYFTCTGMNANLGIGAATASFKDLEAISVLHRLKSFDINKPLVLSSAGNTARAFAYYAGKYSYPVLLVVPHDSRRFLWIPTEKGLRERVSVYVRVVLIDQPGKYSHASMLAENILSLLGDSVIAEGGYFNIGRNCGLSTCALDFYTQTGSLPDHYVQAAGSGVGVLAAMRAYALLDPERSKSISYHLVQNSPYDPLVRAINDGQVFSPLEHYRYIDTVCSPMLTSTDPAFNYPGGIAEAISKGTSTYGYSVNNNEILNMHYEMQELENIQVLLPAAVALAGLLVAKESGKIDPRQTIQVNITGCGEIEAKSKRGFFYLNKSTEEPSPEHISFGGNFFEQWFANVEKDILDFP